MTGSQETPARAVKVIKAGAAPASARRNGVAREHHVEGRHAVGELGAVTEHEAHRKLLCGDPAQSVRIILAGKMRHADQRFRRDLFTHSGDLVRAPQHRQHGDREPGTPRGKQGQRRDGDIGQLCGDGVAGLKSQLDEKRRQRVDRHIGLVIGEASRLPQIQRREIWRVGQRRHARPLLRAPGKQRFSLQRKALVALQCLDRQRTHGGQCLREASPSALAPSDSSHQLSIW